MARAMIVRNEMLRPLFVTMGSRLLDLPSRYAFHLIVAFQLGVAQAGLFYIVFSVLTLASGTGRLGIDRALTREVARAMAHDRINDARRVIRSAIVKVTLLSLSATLLMILLAQPLAIYVVKKPELAHHFVLMALCIPALCLNVVAGGALLGFMRVGLSQMIISWLWPALFCIGALVVPLTLDSALWLLVAATMTNAATGFVLLYFCTPARQQGVGTGPDVPLFGLGWSLFTTELVQLLLSSIPTLMLAAFASESEVGYFSLAWRVALILNLVVTAIAALVSPRFARAHARGEQAELESIATQALVLTMAMGAVPLIILFAAAGTILDIFGSGYDAGASTLRILLVGQLLAMVGTGLPELLGMTGHGVSLRRINLVAGLCLILGLVILTPLLGANGAALAIVAATGATAFMTMRATATHLGFVPLATLRNAWQGAGA